MVQDLRIAFEEVGEGSPAIVMIHGGFANRSHFAAQLDHLSERHRVLAIDLRGHGESDVPKSSVTLRDFAMDVIGVCEAAGVDRAVFCGHSMGGAVALEVATMQPDRVAGVALLDAAILFPEALRAQALAGLVPALEGDAWLDALRTYFGRFFGPYDSPALKARVMAELERVPRHLAAPLMRDVMSSDFAAQLSREDHPLLFIHARVPADLERLRQLRPDVLLGSVVGSGHYLMLEVPDQVNAMLDRFLRIVVSRP